MLWNCRTAALVVASNTTVGLRDIRYRRVVAPDPVELALDRSDILTHRAEAQQSAGVGFPDILDGHIAHKVDIRAVIIAVEYLYRSSALVCQGDGPPTATFHLQVTFFANTRSENCI